MDKFTIIIGGKEYPCEVSDIPEISFDVLPAEGGDDGESLTSTLSFEMPVMLCLDERLAYAEYADFPVWLRGAYKQARTHRRGRVNKKWAKKYGYVKC